MARLDTRKYIEAFNRVLGRDSRDKEVFGFWNARANAVFQGVPMFHEVGTNVGALSKLTRKKLHVVLNTQIFANKPKK